MDDNKFKIQRLAKWREESSQMFQIIGLRAAQYETLLGELADLGTEKIVAQASQFLFDFKEKGPDAMVDRYGVSRSTAYNHRDFALRIVSNSVTGK